MTLNEVFEAFDGVRNAPVNAHSDASEAFGTTSESHAAFGGASIPAHNYLAGQLEPAW